MSKEHRRQIRNIRNKPMRGRKTGAFFVLAMVAVFGGTLLRPLRLNSAAYVPPSSAPPSGDIGLPINITSSQQTKQGSLTLKSGLTISSPSGNPDLQVNGSICWNGDCQSNWPSGSVPGTGFVAITPQATDQAGWVDITGVPGTTVGGDGLTKSYGLHVRSAPPTLTTPTTAVIGYSDPLAVAAASYGVYAAAGADSASNFALYGSAPAGGTSWAGYFAGNVAILAPFDLVIGNGSQNQGPSSTTSEICLNDVCRSTWPTTNDTYWSDTSTAYEAANPTWNFAVGGNDSTAQFYFEVLASPQANFGSGILNSNGTGSSADVTIQ